MRKKILGIIGGMGPEATASVFQKIIKLTEAKTDRDHIEIFIHNNTNVPDRTEAILNNDPVCFKELSRSALILEKLGVDYIIIPCITSHYFVPDLQKRINVPIINAVEQCVDHILEKYSMIKNLGIIATTGTIKSSLFQHRLEKKKLNPVILSDDIQARCVMSAIYGSQGIKAGIISDNVRKRLIEAASHLINDGAEAIIAGCTEIPLAINKSDIPVPLIDPMEVLSIIAIRKCLNRDFV